MIINQYPDGSWYLASRYIRRYKRGNQKDKRAITYKNKCCKDVFFVKFNYDIRYNNGIISLGRCVTLPKEFIGKRVRFKLEVVEEK